MPFSISLLLRWHWILLLPFLCSGLGVWRKQPDQGRPALPSASAMARSAWLLLEEFLAAGLPRVRRRMRRCCVCSSESSWNPSAHFWSQLQKPPCSSWAWTQPRLSILCSVLEASLSPVPLPLRMLLKSILSDISLRFLKRPVPCSMPGCWPALRALLCSALSAGSSAPSAPSLVKLLRENLYPLWLLGLCWWFVQTMKTDSLQKVLRVLHGFPCLLFENAHTN